MLALALTLLALNPTVEKDILYTKVAGEELKLDLYRPAALSPSGLPCVVVVHGGAWMSGNRTDMAPLCEALSKNGFVAATVSYRLAPKHKWPAMLDDVQTSVRFLRANASKYGIDPNRIGAAGASAGGHLSLFLGTRDTRDPNPTDYPKVSSRVSAVFDIFGPTDLTQGFSEALEPLYPIVLGKKRSEAASELRDASPIFFVNGKTAPVFILHGEKDPIVPIAQSRTLEAKLKELKVPVQAAYIPDMGHEVNRSNPACEKALSDALAWLQQQLAVQDKAQRRAA
jgi:acetyl esterase/lipase